MAAPKKHPDMTKEKWVELCQSFPRSKLREHLAISFSSMDKLEKLYEFKPYKKCARCGLQPSESFESPYDGHCAFHKEQRRKMSRKDWYDSEDLEWNRRFSEFMRKPWIDREGPLQSRYLQGWEECA